MFGIPAVPADLHISLQNDFRRMPNKNKWKFAGSYFLPGSTGREN